MHCYWSSATKPLMWAAKFRHSSKNLNELLPSKLFICGLKKRCLSYRVLFFGSDEFSVQCLEKFQCNLNGVDRQPQVISKLEVVCLSGGDVTAKVMYKYARNQNLKLHMWPYSPPPHQFDIGVVVSFGKLIPSSIINYFPFGMINIHPSLIPKLRGAAPIGRAIEAELKRTGVTILQVSPKKFDRGLILDQSEEITIDQDSNSSQLSNKLASVGGRLCIETLRNLPSRLNDAKLQIESNASYAPKFTLEDSFIDWNIMTATHIWNKFRAFGFRKQFRLRCFYHNGKSLDLIKFVNLQLVKNSVSNLPRDLGPGDVHFDRDSRNLIIGCEIGCIACSELVISNRNPQKAVDFYNGFMQTRLKHGETILFQNA